MCVFTGYSNESIPVFDNDDTIELYVLKAPVWEFKFGRLLADLVGSIHCICSGYHKLYTHLNTYSAPTDARRI